jgi:hypothetical protein
MVAAGTASAGALVSRGRSAGAPAVGTLLAYATHSQLVSANGTLVSHADCPSGALPVGGGATVQDPRIEHVIQAGFHASAATGKFDGYQASLQVSGLPRGAKVRFAVQAACIPAAKILMVYVMHTQVLSANGTTGWGVPCPDGTLPVGGGVMVQNPRAEHVAQAGFHASTAGRVDGYAADVQVSGLARGTKVRFAVQVACISSATAFVVYTLHTQILPANGTTGWGVLCPDGTLPAGGGTAVQNPSAETVTQAGFHASAATGQFDGYQASVEVGGLPRGRAVLFAVQVACVAAAVLPPTYGPPTKTLSASLGSPRAA